MPRKSSTTGCQWAGTSAHAMRRSTPAVEHACESVTRLSDGAPAAGCADVAGSEAGMRKRRQARRTHAAPKTAKTPSTTALSPMLRDAHASTPKDASPIRRSTPPIVLSGLMLCTSDVRLPVASRRFSLNNLIGPREHGGRDHDAEALRGVQVNHQLELRRLLDRHGGWLGASENLVDEDRSAAEEIPPIRRVAHQSSGRDVVLRAEQRR